VTARDVVGSEAWERLESQPGWSRLLARLERGVRSAPRLYEAAALVPQGRTLFHAFFSVITGWAYWQFVKAWKLTEAWRLCHEEPDLPLDEVARRTGYGDDMALVRAYGAFWGETPRGRPIRTRRRQAGRPRRAR